MTETQSFAFSTQGLGLQDLPGTKVGNITLYPKPLGSKMYLDCSLNHGPIWGLDYITAPNIQRCPNFGNSPFEGPGVGTCGERSPNEAILLIARQSTSTLNPTSKP